MNQINEEADIIIDSKRPFYKQVKYQRIIVLVVLTVGLVSTIFITQRNRLIELSDSENQEILVMEDQGFSYAFGTEPSDLGNEIENFTVADEQQLNQLVASIDNNESVLDEEGQDLFELIEYDEWNNNGELSSSVVEELIELTEAQQWKKI